ncbi:MAG: signal peptidase I [Verrucomicrobiota bacterium]|jgi:signal peptidase I
MKFRWFLSRQFRLASGLLDDTRKRRNAQCDLLDPPALQSLDASLRETKAALDAGADDAVLARLGGDLEKAAGQCLTSYPNPGARDNVETLLVVIALAMCVRTFFLQPFKIPTGSMQPTLYGVTARDLRGDPGFVMPGLLGRAWELVVDGAIYHQASVQIAGDHLLVDRFTYNFRPPRRGEIVVFKTGHIPAIGQDLFYIKRLIGLPGDQIVIGDDRHVRINGRRLDSSDPHFQNVYGFDTNAPPAESHYSGHVLDGHSLLKTSADTLEVRDRHYAVFGDNTLNSSDSRFWRDFPQEDLMGRAWFVYWPFSPRFGFAADR